MQFGSSGVGSGSHFSCAKLNAALGIEPTHVPYRGSGLAMQDLIAGRIDYFCALGAAAMGPLEAGNAKAMALLTSERSALFPTLQTSKEQGLPGINSYFWTAFFFPKDTPDAIVQKLYDATNQTLKSPTTVDRLKRAGVAPIAPELRHAGLSENVHRYRGRQLGGDDQGERRYDRMSRHPCGDAWPRSAPSQPMPFAAHRPGDVRHRSR